MFLVEPDKLDIKRHLRGYLFIMHYYEISGRKERETNEKQTQFCSNLLKLQMHYDVNWGRHLTNLHVVITIKVSISQSSSRHRLIIIAQAQFFSDLIS